MELWAGRRAVQVLWAGPPHIGIDQSIECGFELGITVCHLPPGASKWNKIEHRLFSHISMNWRGRPLTSHQVVVELIGATTTKQGLRVHAERDLGTYPPKVVVSDLQMAQVPLTPHDFHGEWNYTINAQRC